MILQAETKRERSEGKKETKRKALSLSPLSLSLSISLPHSLSFLHSLHRHVGPHGLEHRAVHPRLGPRAPRRQREPDSRVVELLGRLALAERGGHRRRLDDLEHLRARAVPRAHLGVELLDGAVEGGVAVLLVPVFFAGGGGVGVGLGDVFFSRRGRTRRGSGKKKEREKTSRSKKKKNRGKRKTKEKTNSHVVRPGPRLVPHPDPKVLDRRRPLLEDLVARDDLSVGLLDLAELGEEVPELGARAGVVGGPELHAEEGGLRVRGGGEVAPDDGVLVELVAALVVF